MQRPPEQRAEPPSAPLRTRRSPASAPAARSSCGCWKLPHSPGERVAKRNARESKYASSLLHPRPSPAPSDAGAQFCAGPFPAQGRRGRRSGAGRFARPPYLPNLAQYAQGLASGGFLFHRPRRILFCQDKREWVADSPGTSRYPPSPPGKKPPYQHLTEPEQADAGSAPAGALTEGRFPAAPSSVICCANATSPPVGEGSVAVSPGASARGRSGRPR